MNRIYMSERDSLCCTSRSDYSSKRMRVGCEANGNAIMVQIEPVHPYRSTLADGRQGVITHVLLHGQCSIAPITKLGEYHVPWQSNCDAASLLLLGFWV